MPLEWLIDLIKEWVLSLAYATEAWVTGKGYLPEADLLEWTTPLNVTGILTPDATCMYFKAGMSAGKPYYRRQDGAFFIWWYPAPVSEWWISVAVWDADNGWRRADPNIEGDYIPWHHGGTATVSVGYNYLKTTFIDRGDPAADDWDHNDLTLDGAWHDLDVSAHVPQNAKAILMKVFIRDNLAGSTFQMRRHENANDWNSVIVYTQVAGLFLSADGTIPIDDDQTIEYKGTNGLQSCYLSIRAWWP